MEVNGENKLMCRYSFIFWLEERSFSSPWKEFSMDNYYVKRKPVFNYISLVVK